MGLTERFRGLYAVLRKMKTLRLEPNLIEIGRKEYSYRQIHLKGHTGDLRHQTAPSTILDDIFTAEIRDGPCRAI